MKHMKQVRRLSKADLIPDTKTIFNRLDVEFLMNNAVYFTLLLMNEDEEFRNMINRIMSNDRNDDEGKCLVLSVNMFNIYYDIVNKYIKEEGLQ